MKITVQAGLSAIDAAAWDALVGGGSPFLEWGWLASLEEAGFWPALAFAPGEAERVPPFAMS